MNITKLILILFVLYGYLSFTKNVNGSVGLNHSKIQSDDSTYIDSIHLVESKNGKGFKYTPTQKEVALGLSFKFSLNPIWTPTDSIILDFEDSLNSILVRYPHIEFSHPLNEYVRQYVGLTDSAGNKHMVILFYWFKESKNPNFGKLSNYNSSLKIVHCNISGLYIMLVYDVKEKKLSSLR